MLPFSPFQKTDDGGLRPSIGDYRRSLLAAASEIEATTSKEWVAERAVFGDARIVERLVLDVRRCLDALELFQLLRKDRDGGPRLHRRAHGLIERAPEPRQRSFVEARRHEDVEAEV